MNKLYQDAHNRPPVDLDMTDGPISVSVPQKISGWTVTFDQDQKNQKVREVDFNALLSTSNVHPRLIFVFLVLHQLRETVGQISASNSMA